MKNKKLKTLLTLGASLAAMILPTVVYAGPFDPITVPQPIGAIPDTGLPDLISGAITLVIIVAGLLFMAYLIWGGIEWLTSGGEKASYQAARDRITHAGIGLAIVLSSWLVIRLLEYIFNFKVVSGVSIPRLVK